MGAIYKSQFATTENVDKAKTGYATLKAAAADIDKISSDLEVQCLRKVPKFVKVKDSLSENTSTNLEAFSSVCSKESSKITSAIGEGFDNSTYHTEAKKKDDAIANAAYLRALAAEKKETNTA